MEIVKSQPDISRWDSSESQDADLAGDPGITVTDNRVSGGTMEDLSSSESNVPTLIVNERNPDTAPEDYYLANDKIEDLVSDEKVTEILNESSPENDIEETVEVSEESMEVANNDASYQPYHYVNIEDSHLVFMRSEDGVQAYVLDTQSLNIALLELEDGEEGYNLKVLSRPVYQYRDGNDWKDYEEVVPMEVRVEEGDSVVTLTQKYELTAGEDSSGIDGETELKVGFDGDQYVNKLTFRLGDNDNLNRVKWESKIVEDSVCKIVMQKDENSDTGEKAAVGYDCGDIDIEWKDFLDSEENIDGEDSLESKSQNGVASVIFHPEGVQGALEIDPTLSTTVASTTFNISVADEFEIEIDSAKGGIIDSWFDLENDSGKADQLADATDGLFDFYGTDGSTRRVSDSTSTTQQVLEVTNTRAIVQYAGNMGAANYDYILTYTIYATGEIYIKLEITNNTGSSVTWTNQKAEVSIDSATNHNADGDGVTSNGEAMVVGTNNWVKWVGDGTTEKDTAVLYHHSGFNYNEYYITGTKVAFERDIDEAQADGAATTRIFKVQVRPDTDDLGTGETEPDKYSNEYRNPNDLSFSTGSGWYDTDENTTSATDEFNEEEGVYVMEVATSSDTNIWWDSNWTKRRKITFDNADQSSNLNDFPVLVKLDNTKIDYAYTQSAGQDLRFVDADGRTLLKHEIEEFNETGNDWVWVRVPQVDASSTTDFIWMYYGNASASASPSTWAEEVWDEQFKGVWHLGETTSATRYDSTKESNDLTDSNNVELTTEGRVGSAADFELGDSEYLYRNEPTSLDIHGADQHLTVSAWIKRESDTGVNEAIASKYNYSSSDPQRQYGLYIPSSWDGSSLVISSDGTSRDS
ncbi:MAG: DUF2341 domain-containing protein, partial [Patescibacteria group bacterium]|nr:DUF2341 domain-containing protein [Patescibacteria group bacterium]